MLLGVDGNDDRSFSELYYKEVVQTGRATWCVKAEFVFLACERRFCLAQLEVRTFS